MREVLEAPASSSLRSYALRSIIGAMTIFCMLVLTLAFTSRALAQDGNAAAMPVILGQSLKSKEGKVEPGPKVEAEKGEKSELKTRPIGASIFKVVVEVAHPDELKAGENVDVSVVTLGNEGSHSTSVIKNVRLHSVEKLPGATNQVPPEEANDAETVIEHGHELPAIFPTRIVGLVVKGNEMEKVRLADAQGVLRVSAHAHKESGGILSEIANNFVSNLFQPLLLFFFMGFAIPLLRVPFEFPKALYQSLTIYLLVAIGWHGGELMAELPSSELAVAGGLAAVGFIVNGIIGISATWLLRVFTPMRRIDAVTVGSYYGSDSAGTFVTCLGILAALGIHHDSYMPVMLAVMEIPGCLVGLTLISRLRRNGMDKLGNMPEEPGYLAMPMHC